MLAPDTLLQNRYLIVRQLGQGGMVTVYEAVDQRLDTTVALKETFFSDERLRKQFEREARLLARLHHPALPRVSDHFTEGEGQFLVMQFIAGEDLAEMIQRKGGAAFPPDEVVRWGDQLLDALDYLHTQDPQIVHRDIKPQNLKLTNRGQIILLDFGLAKSFANLLSQVSTTASIFGYTPNYAPLEQIQGLGTDARSDIYSLAATLYHLMTGTKPPDALTRAASVVNGQPDPLQPAHEVNPQISQSVSLVLTQAMSQNRDQRYDSASLMRKALTGVSQPETIADRSEANTVIMPAATTRASVPATVQQNPLEAETVTAVAQNAPPARSSRAWMVAAPVLVLLILGGGIFYALQHRAQQTPQADPPAPPVSSNQNSAPSPAPVSSPVVS
ncbi:MAG: protein kinase, partial [Pyrinomonadaceae bacterium]